MRISFTDIERPKVAAKLLSRISPSLTLASVHEAMAKASGYRDWHELSASFDNAPHALIDFGHETAARLVLELATKLNLDCGDVQFAISKSRLLGPSRWSNSDQIAIYMAALRSGFLGDHTRGKPGTVVRMKSKGTPRIGYLLSKNRTVRLLTDSGVADRADFEVVTPRTPIADFLPARLWLPYGVWTLEDESEVLFARDYLPLWRVSEGRIERLDPWLWIRGIKSQRWFAHNTEGDWWRPPGRGPALAYLERHRILELPRLGNAMLDMFAPGVENISGAVRSMHGRLQSDTLPTFAELNTKLLEGW